MPRTEPIIACCVTVPRLKNLEILVPKVLPYVDKFILIVGREDAKVDHFLSTQGSKIDRVYYPWRDNFADSYNQYVKRVPVGAWFISVDDDEVPSDGMLQSLDGFVTASEKGQKFCCVEFRANPIYIDTDGKEHDNGPCNYYRQMLTRKTPSMHYRGGPISGMHQYAVGHQNSRLVRSDLVYYHIKSVSDEHRNAFRNWTISGIWRHNTKEGDLCSEWQEMNKIIKEEYPQVQGFMDLDDILIAGNISPRLKEWMIRLYQERLGHPDFNEGRAACTYYYKHLHPEEKPEGLEL